jgi:hypothetical protein
MAVGSRLSCSAARESGQLRVPVRNACAMPRKDRPREWWTVSPSRFDVSLIAWISTRSRSPRVRWDLGLWRLVASRTAPTSITRMERTSATFTRDTQAVRSVEFLGCVQAWPVPLAAQVALGSGLPSSPLASSSPSSSASAPPAFSPHPSTSPSG